MSMGFSFFDSSISDSLATENMNATRSVLEQT